MLQLAKQRWRVGEVLAAEVCQQAIVDGVRPSLQCDGLE